jgi:hypothetical protein
VELTHRPGSETPLVVQGGAVDLSFGLSLAAIVSLLRAGDVPEGADLAPLLAVPSLVDLAPGATVDLAGRTISGLAGAIPEGMAVVAIVRLADGTHRVLRHAPGTAEPLRVTGGTVRLDLPAALPPLLAVVAQDGPLAQGPRGGSPPDLRLTAPSGLRRDPQDGRVTAIVGLNPLVPDGTEVTVTFVDASGVPTIHNGDESVRTWRDTGLAGGTRYTYHVRAVRHVTAGHASGGPPTTWRIRSRPAGPVPVTPLGGGP